MKQLFTLLLLLFIGHNALFSQISFYNANDRIGNPDFHSGVAIGVADMNNDGLDDIVRLSESRVLNLEFQQAGNQKFENLVVEQVSNQSQWSLVVGDVNNDGFNDLICGGRYDGVKLLTSLDEASDFEMSFLPEDDLFMQASNMVDINNDGYIDYFACHDDAESRIWRNDSTGHFVPADDWIDMSTVPASDNSGNYGSIWTDFDHDGDIDLYIAKCRQGVNNPSDPRRINALYVNDGNGNFTEQAEAANLKIGAQSWTADFQDIDNDGDYDCFVTNHDAPSMLLENDGSGVFTDITEGSGISIGGLPIQGVMRDFDNDGFVDIIVAGSAHFLYRNNGDKTFTEVEDIFDDNDMESFAIGDLNHDGFLDVYGGYAEIYTTPSNIDDVLWLNKGNEEHHFVAVRLVGQQSNSNGIGARIEIYGEWGIQVREVRAGESYGIMNSMTQHFGLGTAELIDSMIIRWPSGQIDQFEDVAADQFVTVVEGSCISPVAQVTVEGETTICDGDEVLLTASGGSAYLWNTGETTQSILADAAGGYTAIVSDSSACSSNTPMVEITANPDETPTIEVEGELTFCEGESVYLVASEAASYDWSNGATTAAVEITASGVYSVTTEGLCESFTSAPVEVTVLTSEMPLFLSDEFAAGDSVDITVSGSDVYWYETEESMMPFANGNTVRLPIVNAAALAHVENHENYPGAFYNTGQFMHEGGAYSGNQYNGGIIFDCFAPFVLRTVTVYTDTEGERRIQLENASGTVLQSIDVFVPEGETTLELNFDVEPGTELFLTTSSAFNQSNFGYSSPRFQRSDEGIDYDEYVVDGMVKLNSSNFGSDRYYYFYNWKVQEPSYNCVSERNLVGVYILDTDEAFADQQLKIAPNPTASIINIELPNQAATDYQLKVFSMDGQLLVQKGLARQLGTYQLSLDDMPAGMYFVQLQDQNTTYAARLIKS
jgi:hypothetical protein